MAKCYRAKFDADAKLYSESDMRILMRNVAVHLHNITATASETKLTKTAKTACEGLKTASVVLAKAVQKQLKAFYKDSFLPDVYLIYFSWWLPKIYNFAKALVLGSYEAISDFRRHRGYVKLKNRGRAPVVLSLDNDALLRKNGNWRGENGDLHSQINANQKAGGVLIINSEGSYQSCVSALKNYSGKNKCFSAYNGAFVAVSDGDNGLKIINDKHLPAKPMEDLYWYLSNPEKKELLKDYYMVVQGKSDKVGVVDFYTGKVKGFSGGKFTSNPLEVEALLKNAYNIRFEPKKKGNGSLNEVAGNAASVLGKLPDHLKSSLNEVANLQFTRNGSVTLVPKGCSKFEATKMIADAYGLGLKQVLNLAGSTADVCAPVEIEKIADYISKGGNAAGMSAKLTEIAPELLENPQGLGILTGFIDSKDMKILRDKAYNDVAAENIRIIKKKNDAEFKKFETEETKKLKEDINHYREEFEKIEGTDEESEKQKIAIKQYMEDKISSYNGRLEMKRNELDSKEAAPALDFYNLEVQNIFEISKKVTKLSRNKVDRIIESKSAAASAETKEHTASAA